MGIRPTLYVLCGITNLKTRAGKITDPRLTPNALFRAWNYEDEEWCDPPCPTPIPTTRDFDSHYAAEILRGKRIRDVLHYDSEYGCKNVIGHVVDKTEYSPDFLWALASVYKRFRKSGWVELGKNRPEKDSYMWRYYEYSGLYKNLLERDRLYWGLHEEYEAHEYVALFLFEQIGLTVNRDDIKLMLYWNWG